MQHPTDRFGRSAGAPIRKLGTGSFVVFVEQGRIILEVHFQQCVAANRRENHKKRVSQIFRAPKVAFDTTHSPQDRAHAGDTVAQCRYLPCIAIEGPCTYSRQHTSQEVLPATASHINHLLRVQSPPRSTLHINFRVNHLH